MSIGPLRQDQAHDIQQRAHDIAMAKIELKVPQHTSSERLRLHAHELHRIAGELERFRALLVRLRGFLSHRIDDEPMAEMIEDALSGRSPTEADSYRCEHGVWLFDHCYSCAAEEPRSQSNG